jgi:hypothetical protein
MEATIKGATAMNRKMVTIPREELQPGDKVWTTSTNGLCWWNEVATIEHGAIRSQATFMPASRPAKVGYAVITPRPSSFYGADVEVMRGVK